MTAKFWKISEMHRISWLKRELAWCSTTGLLEWVKLRARMVNRKSQESSNSQSIQGEIGKSTGNHRLSHKTWINIWGFPVTIFPEKAMETQHFAHDLLRVWASAPGWSSAAAPFPTCPRCRSGDRWDRTCSETWRSPGSCGGFGPVFWGPRYWEQLGKMGHFWVGHDENLWNMDQHGKLLQALLDFMFMQDIAALPCPT